MNKHRSLEFAGAVVYIASMTKGPRKSTGEIRASRITQTAEGARAETIPTTLPSDKECLGKFFADRPLGPQIAISDLVPNDTSDFQLYYDGKENFFLGDRLS